MIKTALFISVLFIFSSAQAQIMAKVGNKTITKKEFDKSYAKALENSQSLKRLPSREEHLEDLVRFELGLLEAKKTKVASNPNVKRALELTLYKGLLEVNLADKIDKIKVSESEMKSYYRKNPQMRSSHIFVRLPENPNSKQIKEAKARANKIYSTVLTQKKPWEVNVRNLSDDELTKATSGDMGYHDSSTLYPAYYDALKPLKVGQIAKPVRGLYGYHIIKKTGQLSYDRADKNIIKLSVFNEKRFEVLDAYFSSLKRKHRVSYNKDAL
jgi:peptidyl-prolyl cis-trans isomerase C/peptidyl-prolyl cis-trans isomerase D